MKLPSTIRFADKNIQDAFYKLEQGDASERELFSTWFSGWLNKKLFYGVLLVILFATLIIIFFSTKNTKPLVSNINLMKLCEDTGGSWVERGTDEECNGLNEEECSRNPDCMALMIPVGPKLPAFRFGECKHFASCGCPNDRSFYFNTGCEN